MNNILKIEFDFKKFYDFLRSANDTKAYLWNNGITVYFHAFCGGDHFTYRGTHTEVSANFTMSIYPCELGKEHITIPAKTGEPVVFPKDIESQVIRAIYAGINKFYPEYKGYKFEIKNARAAW